MFSTMNMIHDNRSFKDAQVSIHRCLTHSLCEMAYDSFTVTIFVKCCCQGNIFFGYCLLGNKDVWYFRGLFSLHHPIICIYYAAGQHPIKILMTTLNHCHKPTGLCYIHCYKTSVEKCIPF